MTTLKTFVALLGQVIIATAYAAEPADAPKSRGDACIIQFTERTAALVARDWGQLARLAQRYLDTCKDIFGAEDYSEAYEHIAIAHLFLGNLEKALLACDQCTNAFYPNSGCHLQRVEVYVGLKRLPDAKSALERAERLIEHNIELRQRNLIDARSASDREVAEARLRNLKSQKTHAAALRTRHIAE